MVFGKDIGKPNLDLIAKYANAWDSTKSPFTLYSSINFIIFLGFSFEINFLRFEHILFTKYLFFLPPPQRINIGL